MHKFRKVALSGIAAAGAAALVLGMGAPAMAAVKPEFGNVKASTPGAVKTPKLGSSVPSQKWFQVTFDGPVDTVNPSNITYQLADQAYYGPKVTPHQVNKGVRSSQVVKPYVDGPLTSFSPAGAVSATVRAYTYTTPGKYKVVVPVTQRVFQNVAPYTVRTTRTATTYITVNANPATSKYDTRTPGYGRVGKTWKIQASAPAYQTGAKATLYAKVKGSKKFVKASSTVKLKASKNRAVANLKLNGKFTKKNAQYYVKVTKVAYAPAYTGPTYKIR